MTEDNTTPSPVDHVRGLDLETIEACARLIEENIVQDTSAGKVLKPRQDGNRDGLAYAAAIRDLVTNHGSKSDLHPEYVTSPDGTDHGCKSTLHPGNVPPGGDK